VVQLLHILGGVLSHPAGPSTLVKRHIGAGVSHGDVHGGHWLARRAVPHNLLDAAQAAHAAVQDAARTIHTRLQPSFDPLDSHPPYSHTTSVSMFIPTTSGGSESHVSAPTGSPHDAAPFVVITEKSKHHFFPLSFENAKIERNENRVSFAQQYRREDLVARRRNSRSNLKRRRRRAKMRPLEMGARSPQPSRHRGKEKGPMGGATHCSDSRQR